VRYRCGFCGSVVGTELIFKIDSVQKQRGHLFCHTVESNVRNMRHNKRRRGKIFFNHATFHFLKVLCEFKKRELFGAKIDDIFSLFVLNYLFYALTKANYSDF
jgi:hypothetical protein